jgi:hypothetical protein
MQLLVGRLAMGRSGGTRRPIANVAVCHRAEAAERDTLEARVYVRVRTGSVKGSSGSLGPGLWADRCRLSDGNICSLAANFIY